MKVLKYLKGTLEYRITYNTSRALTGFVIRIEYDIMNIKNQFLDIVSQYALTFFHEAINNDQPCYYHLSKFNTKQFVL